MSERASTSRASRNCSGDMYEGEPMADAAWVRAWSLAVSGVLEMPKSSTLTMGGPLGRVARKRLPGLRSRWTMPAACASAMASQASSR